MWASLAVAVCFLLTIPTAEACTCWAMHLQHDFCTSNVAIKGKFLSMAEPEVHSSDIPQDEEWDTYYTYKVEVLEVFKGGPGIKDSTFKSHTFMCPFYLPSSALNVDYLITGSSSRGEVLLGFCNYIVPWSEVSVRQLKGIKGDYSKGCSCRITSPDTDYDKSRRCLYKDYGPQGPHQDKNQRCVPVGDETCSWEDIPD